MSDAEYKGEPIDASWSTAPWNREGETVEASDDNAEEHDMDTIEWPEGATPKEELNDAQIAVIEKAARYRNLDNSRKLTRLAVGDEKSTAYANYVLQSHWPERYWGETENDVANQPRSINTDKVKTLRKEALGGKNAVELAEEYDESRSVVNAALRGAEPYDQISEPPKLEYNFAQSVYEPVEDTYTNTSTNEKEEYDDESEDTERMETAEAPPRMSEKESPDVRTIVSIVAGIYVVYRLIRRIV